MIALLVLLACQPDPERGGPADASPPDSATDTDIGTSGPPDTDTDVATDTGPTDTAPATSGIRRLLGPIELASGAAYWKIEGSAEARLGEALGVAGDITGDGLADVIANAGGEVIGTDNGINYLLLGGTPPGLTNAAAAGFRILDPSPGTRGSYWFTTNRAVASPGDIDGDGLLDLALANFARQAIEGGVYLIGGLDTAVPGDHISLPSRFARIQSFRNGFTLFGLSILYADLSGDGTDDLVVTETLSGGDDGYLDGGRAWIFNGPVPPGDHTTEAAAVMLQGSYSDGPIQFGNSSQSADVNGDGLDDLIVAAHESVQTPTDAGAVYIFFGPVLSSGFAHDLADLVLLGEDFLDGLGAHQAALGDTNGDGYDDLAFGALTDTVAGNAGSVFLFQGPLAAGPPVAVSLVADAEYQGIDQGDYAQYPNAAGDLDRDGFNDLLIGAWEVGPRNEGGVHLLYGALPLGVHVIDTVADATIYGEAPGDLMFTAVAPGDMNGDGMPDLVLGAQDHAGAAGDQTGAVYMLLGGTY